MVSFHWRIGRSQAGCDLAVRCASLIRISGLASLAFILLGARAAAADVKLGILKHDVSFIGDALGVGASARESGVDVSLGVYFERPFAKNNPFVPRPYLIGSVNSAGDTSFIGGGISYKFNFLHRFYFHPEIGLVVHNGEIAFRPLRETPPDQRLTESQRRSGLTQLGSRVLFQPGLSLGMNITPRTALEFSYLHISNGQILNGHVFGRSGDVNEGIDMVGGRLVYRFGKSAHRSRK